MTKNPINPSQIKLLWGKSFGRCAMCKLKLIKSMEDGKEYSVGKMAHIQGENPGSARYNPNMTDEERSSYDNLILLCPTHHETIDKDEHQYTAEKLKKIKNEHEKWAEDSLRSHVPEITFAELEVIIKYLTSAAIPVEDNLTIVPPKEKMKKNNLSPGIGNLITMGLSQVRLVENYLNKHPDIQFAARLKAEFVSKFIDLKHKDFESDSLFYELLDFASNNSMEFKEKSAGLSVLAYFFERCDVFEE
jgi:hypothetical protein